MTNNISNIVVSVDSSEIDQTIEKANKLLSLLKEAKEIISSLSVTNVVNNYTTNILNDN